MTNQEEALVIFGVMFLGALYLLGYWIYLHFKCKRIVANIKRLADECEEVERRARRKV